MEVIGYPLSAGADVVESEILTDYARQPSVPNFIIEGISVLSKMKWHYLRCFSLPRP